MSFDIQKKTVILLGAGAMKPWGGPLATDIDEYLAGIDQYKTRHEVPQSVFSFLIKEIKNYFPGDNAYFETVVAVVEALYSQSAGRLFQNYYKQGNILSFLFDNKTWVDLIKDYNIQELLDEDNQMVLEYKKHIHSANGYSPIENRDAADMMYFRDLFAFLLDRIGDKVTEYDNLDSLFSTSKLNEALISFLYSNSGNITRIYSLNYDRVIPKLLRDKSIPLFDGFCDSMSHDYVAKYPPDIHRILRDSVSLNYYNIHGSIYWERITEISQLDHMFICTPNKDQSNYATYTHAASNPKEQFLISNIVTGHHKLQRTNLQPLNAFSYAFQRDCLEADNLVIIGYSFSDIHINRIIRNGIEATGERQKRYFINYFPDADTDDYLTYNNEGHRLSKELFGAHSFRKNEAIVDNGWLSFRKHNCHIYINGFKSILEAKTNIDDLT